MLAAPPPLSDRDEVLALLRAWHADSPGTRVDPRSLTIASVVASPIHRVAITRVAENRGIDVRPRMAAARRSVAGAPPVDVWQYDELFIPLGSTLGTRVEKVLEGLPERVSDCPRCHGEGKVTCAPCQGTGVRGQGQLRHVCAACSGVGHTPCVPCGGLGGFLGAPVAWSAIVEGTMTRIVRPAWLANDVALAIDAALAQGTGSIVTRDDAWNGAVHRSAGYRDASLASPLGDEIRALFSELEATTLGRVRAHRLEIRRVVVYQVTLASGGSFVTWGHPTMVSPEDALDAPSAALRRSLRLIGVGVLLAMLLAWTMRFH